MIGAIIHPSADVSPDARIGSGSRIWNNAQIRERAFIGRDCIIGMNVYVDVGVVLGDRIKVQNNTSIYRGVTIEDSVFIGPHVCFSNDRLPRAGTPTGTLKREHDWVLGKTLVREGASIGAGSVILPNIIIGAFALVGAGSVVTHSVSAQALVYGNPARPHAYVCRCGHPLDMGQSDREQVFVACTTCHEEYIFGLDEEHTPLARRW